MPFSEANNRSDDPAEFARLIAEARAGSDEALSRLVESCRPYLMFIANNEIDPNIRGKVGASDVVQESLIAAHAMLPDFQGDTQYELRAWLRRILLNDLQDTRRKFVTDKRNVEREIPLRTDSRLIDVVNPDFTPRTEAQVAEETQLLRMAVEKLPDDYQQVIRLRNWQQQSFPEIATVMNRSSEAVRKLWSRAINQLQIELEQLPPADGSMDSVDS